MSILSGLRALALSLALLALILLTACPPVYGPTPELPRPPGGSGSAAGKLNFSAPEVELYFDAPAGSSMARGTLTSLPPAGLIYSNYEVPAAFITSYDAVPQRVGVGQWELPFDVGDLAFGDFQLCGISTQFGDFGVPPHYSPVEPRQQFALGSEGPRREGLELSFNLGGGDGAAVLRGRLMLGGNPPASGTLALALGSSGEGTAPAYSSFNLPLSGVRFGRVFYEVNHLAGTSATAGLYSSSLISSEAVSYRIDGQPAPDGGYIPNADGSISGGATDVEDTASHRLDMYIVLRQSSAGVDDHDAQALESGEIICRIDTGGVLSWSDDILISATPADSAAGLNREARAFLLPEQIGLGGIATLKLQYLKPGSYSIQAYRLGADNNTPPELIGGAAGTVLLEQPPLDYIADLTGKRYYFQPEPQARVDFAISP